jgi:L-lactate dehydrogenase
MVMRGVGQEIVLIDRNAELADAQARDILHATPFAYPVPVRAGGYAEARGAGIVVLAAGANQLPGESRLALLTRNAAVFAEIVPQVLAVAPDALLLVASNPVDIVTWIVSRLAARAGVPAGRVIGSGTILDTARFRALLGQHFGLSPKSVHAQVLGEHGDSEVRHWSGARVGGLPLDQVAAELGRPLDEAARAAIDAGVRHAAAAIIRGKGATWFGIGGGLARLAQIIAGDEHAVVTCSMAEAEVAGVPDLALSLPRVVAAAGIVATLPPGLDAAEQAGLRRSAEVLKAAAEGLAP